MIFLYGEWPFANLLFGFTFLFATLGVIAIGYWVVHSDRLNRVGEDIEPAESAEHEPAGEH